MGKRWYRRKVNVNRHLGTGFVSRKGITLAVKTVEFVRDRMLYIVLHYSTESACSS